MKIVNRTPRKTQSFAAGYHLLATGEALLQEAQTDPRDFGKGWYLRNLFKIVFMLDVLRPGHAEVGNKNFDKYDAREKAYSLRVSQFADTIDPKLRETIRTSVRRLEEEMEMLPTGRPRNPKDDILGIRRN